MLATATKNQIFLARAVVVLIIAFLVAGVSTYGYSAEVRARFWHDLLERPDQFMRFRFILQPIMAAIAALHDGIEDARTSGDRPTFGRCSAVHRSASAAWKKG